MDKVPNTMYMYVPKSIGIFPPNFTSIYHTEKFHVGPY